MADFRLMGNSIGGWGIFITNKGNPNYGYLAGGGWCGEYYPKSPFPAAIFRTRQEARDKLKKSKQHSSEELWNIFIKDNSFCVVKIRFEALIGWGS